MSKAFRVLMIAITLMSCEQKKQKNIEELKKQFIRDDLSIYLENVSGTDINPDRYTFDNTIYTINKRFVFDYSIYKHNDTLKISCPKISVSSDYQRDWRFVPSNSIDEDKIETISLTVLPGVSNINQTAIKYEYQYVIDPGYSIFSSTSGVIENEMNTWIHPHRDKYFMILELNPFPFIQQPFEIGHEWRWSLDIGDYWKDPRWLMWTGPIKNNYTYKITAQEKIKTKIGRLECWVIEGVAKSTIGTTGLVAYYNEQYGFVKLDYVNIDKSKLTIEIKSIR